MSTGMDPDSRVALAEIKGDVKLILAGQERVHADIAALNRRIDGHDSRIRSLETDKISRDGERKGVSVSSRIAWAVVSLLVGSGGAIAILEALK